MSMARGVRHPLAPHCTATTKTRVALQAAVARRKNMRSRLLFIAACSIFFPLGPTATEAIAADVQQDCKSDFQRYRGSYDPYSASGNACMRSMGRSHRLNRDCVRALEEGGYVTQADR